MTTPSFVLELRKAIGHAPLWLMGASLLCLREGDAGPEVLLQRRADNNRWALISGIVEPGEHPSECLVREAWEEVAAQVEVGRMLWCVVTEPKTYRNGDEVQYLDLGFVGRVIGGALRSDEEETTAVDWFPVDELPMPYQSSLPKQVAVALEDPRDVVASWDA